MERQKKAPRAGGARENGAGGAKFKRHPEYTTAIIESQSPSRNRGLSTCQIIDSALSPETLARLKLLSQRTGLEPALIVEALIRGADPQLVLTVATLTPRFIASGWRPSRFIPLTFIVADVGQEGDHG